MAIIPFYKTITFALVAALLLDSSAAELSKCMDWTLGDPLKGYMLTCNGLDFSKQHACSKLEMSPELLGRCHTIPWGAFYGRILSVTHHGLEDGACCELFTAVQCSGNSTRIESPVLNLNKQCGFGGSEGLGQTKSVVCWGKEKCQERKTKFDICGQKLGK